MIATSRAPAGPTCGVGCVDVIWFVGRCPLRVCSGHSLDGRGTDVLIRWLILVLDKTAVWWACVTI